MSKSNALSGAAKRKKQREFEKEIKKYKSISTFMQCQPVEATIEKNEETQSDNNQSKSSIDTDISNASKVDIDIEPEVDKSTDPELHESNMDIDGCCSSQLLSNEHPTDRGHHPDVLDANMKRFILENGSCRPSGPYPRDFKNRCFTENFFYAQTKAGLKIPVTWLCYSKKLNAAYCEVCWLFSDRSDPSYRENWSNGIQDWQGLSKKITKHAISKCHTASCLVYEHWKRHSTLNEESEKVYQKDKLFWREVLKRLVKITLLLACNGQSFRGHRENIDDIYNGNFLSEVQLLAEFDPIMNELINKPKHSIKYLSPIVQNELITVLSEHLENQITEEIKSAMFYSIIADTTQDISKKDQLSLIIRYVKIVNDTNDKPVEIKVIESFLGFFWTKDHSAKGLSNHLIQNLQNLGISLINCRGQGYDGASVMSGIYGGVQKLINDEQPNALFVHCAAHNLNLVINDAVSSVPEAVKFFTILQEVYKFFGQSINRWDMLSDVTGESTVTLKKLNPTRWAGRLLTVLGMKHNYATILKLLTKINLQSSKKDEIAEAFQLKKNIEQFEFVFLLVLFSRILGAIDVASKCLQNEKADLCQATYHLETALKATTSYRENFTEAKQESISVAQKWGIEVKFQVKRMRKTKRHFDELADDHRLNDPEDEFRINTFNRVLDIVNAQLQTRFKGMNDVVSRFSVLFPANLINKEENVIILEASSLQSKYPDDISPEFPIQLLSFRTTMEREIKKTTTVKQLADLLMLQYAAISSSYPDVCTAFILFLSLPVTVASAERSFSKLKYIKSYLRNSMAQERLKGLALLNIEAARAKVMDMDKLIDRFAEMKARRKKIV